MTFCLGAKSLRAPPLIAHRLDPLGSALALSPACRKADARGFRFSHRMRQLVAPTGGPRRVRVPPSRELVPGVGAETCSSPRRLGVRLAAHAASGAALQSVALGAHRSRLESKGIHHEA
jgi:hypothetical protein